MLYIGTVDDKTIQYPFGAVSGKAFGAQRILLHHILFGSKPLVLEEGFVMASDEALRPGTAVSFLLHAIETGHIKIASRYGDMHAYAEERRRYLHAAPPPDRAGDDYIHRLQEACVRANAFLRYPPERIDEITFERFRAIAESNYVADAMSFGEVDIPTTFARVYEESYRTGNRGQQWTARAAWEKTLTQMFQGQDKVIHTMMALANRERQILRAAAIAKVNGVSMEIETGFEQTPHDLAEPVARVSKIAHTQEQYLCPRIALDDLLQSTNAQKILERLSNENTLLAKYRKVYVSLLETSAREEVCLKELKRAALDYEREIYASIERTPFEQSSVGRFAVSAGVGLAVGSVWRVLADRLKENSHRPIFSKKLKRTYTRRQVLGAMTGMVVFTGIKVAEDHCETLAQQGIRTVRIASSEDVADDELYSAHTHVACSHQILAIKEANLHSLKL